MSLEMPPENWGLFWLLPSQISKLIKSLPNVMRYLLASVFALLASICYPQSSDSSEYVLIWQEEFDSSGPVDGSKWSFERGFVRNQELQWYQEGNAKV
jgi:hypothetical protein